MNATEQIDRLARTLGNVTPERLRSLAEPAYYRYRSWAADRRHVPPDERIERVPDAPAHVLLLVVDCLRPDERLDLPISYASAVAPSTWTFPSVTSIHTGLAPGQHGAVAHTHPESDEYALPEQTAMRPAVPRRFEAAGYDTLAVSAFMMPHLALEGWYETHEVFQSAPAADVVSTYRSWRSGRDRTFAYLHFGDLHEPMTPPTEYVEDEDVDRSLPNLGRMSEYTDDYDGSDEARHFRTHRLRLYRAARRYLEDQLRPLLEEVRENTLVVLCGDHGEAHWEHYERDRRMTDSRPNYGVGHGGTPFDMVARVPVGTHAPGRDLRPRGGVATLCDIPRTLCGAALESVPNRHADWHERLPDDRIVHCEGVRYGVERKAAYRGRHKVIRSDADDVTWTATVDEEAGETFTSIPDQERQALLASLPERWERFETSDEPGEMVKSQLEALGYK